MLHYKIKELRPANALPKEQSLAARQLLLQLLSEHCGIDALPVMGMWFGGKPYFPHYPHINFNLAHCKSAAMAVISDKEVGCDIEDVLTKESLILLHVVFKQEDIDIILASDNPPLEMTKLWTRKEALVKHDGNIPDDPADRPSLKSTSINIFTQHQQGCPYVYSIACIEAMP